MEKKRVNKIKYKICFIIPIIIIIGAIFFNNSNKSLSIFSWENKELDLNDIGTMKEYLSKLNIKYIYQNIDNHNNDEIKMFVKSLKAVNVDIYALSGEAQWYKEGETIKAYLDNIDDYNKNTEKEYRINGAVLDIEPWIIDENWDRHIYTENMKKIYEYAKKLNIKLVNVIPTWLDTSDLDVIIKNSDKVAVMNYNVNSPIKNIKEEIYIAQKYKKYIDIIAETQPVNDKYGVEKNTTYYYLSHKKLLEDWKEIKEVYNYKGINFSYHDYKNIKKFVNLGE